MMNYWNDDAPNWATTVIKGGGGVEYYASDWGTKNGARQKVGSNRREYGEANMSSPHSWTLVSTKPKPFNYLTDPWKIRTGDAVTSKRVQEFLFAQGIYWDSFVGGKVIKGFKDKYVTNLEHGGTVSEGVILYGTTLNEFEGIQATEIVLTFETVVKSVEYIPVVAKKTEAEIATEKAKVALESLMIKIDELSKEATKLQNVISGEIA